MTGVLLFAMSMVASAIGGVLGMAGGVLIVPMLTACGIGIHKAIGASIVAVIASSCASSPAFLRHRLTNIRLAVVLELATTIGALTGVCLVGVLPTSVLFLLFAAILLLSAQQMLVRRRGRPTAQLTAGWGTALSLHSSYPDPRSGGDTPYVVQRVPTAMVLMYGAGLVSALLGIGSGVLKTPAMDTALRLPLKVSSATSTLMIGVTGAASAGVYFARGDVVPSIAGPVALGAVLGALLGARLFLAITGATLRWMFVSILVLLAGQMLLEAFGVHLFGALA